MAIKVGVIGASGYAGGELLRLLLGHPEFKISYISAGSNAGELITSVHPALTSFTGERFEATSAEKANGCELLFIALPHGESAKLISEIKPEVKIVDLGADYRLANSASWDKYYGGLYAGKWSYGAAEIPGFASQVAHSARVANPGCYATAIELACAPALTAKIIDPTDIVAVAASGTTGAGRSAKINLLGSEVMNSLSSYKFGGVHQHTPEIEETLTELTGNAVTLSFTPILAPMPRGILATLTSKITEKLDSAEVHKIYSDYFADSPFVHLLPLGQMPTTSAVLGTNDAHVQVAVDTHANRLVVSTAIDNLGKGAAAQAIHNANLMLGLEITSGLIGQGVR